MAIDNKDMTTLLVHSIKFWYLQMSPNLHPQQMACFQ